MDQEIPDGQDWNPWDQNTVKKLGDSYYKRAKGELPEKESSKSLARFLEEKDFYSEGDTLLDVGCASGHFLRSLQRLLDPDINYTGIDVNMQYLQWGGEIFGIDDQSNFIQCDALNVPVEDNAFDIVFVNLFHFFPRIDEPLKEAMRVASEHVIWRTPIGEVNYVAKAIHNDSFEELGLYGPNDDDLGGTLYMMYSEKYLRGMFEEFGWDLQLIEKDTDFEQFDNNELDEMEEVAATKVVDDMQINGNLVLDWQYVVLDATSV
jgi:ubiquinone/menaquinone biosynthesis C-methylase UbiE